MVDPVTVWVATDEDRDQYIFRSKPEWHKTLWNSDDTYEQLPDEMCISVAPGQCIEYVMIPVDQYREMQRPQPVELSPVAKLIAELSVSAAIEYAKAGNAMAIERTVDLASAHVKLAIAAARDIESERKQ